MEKLLKPKSVAIVGASDKEGKIGNILIKNIKGENGVNVFPVNPKGGEIEGFKVYGSVLDIVADVELVVIAVPAKFVNKVVEECALREQSIKDIIIISAGFGEAGEEGLIRKAELEELIKKYELNILGPNCLGIINATEKINLSFAKKEVISGGVGLISQSGAFITSMIDIAEQGVSSGVGQFGFSLITSLGNKIDVSENELLEYYTEDEDTKIIALYLENISKGIEFKKQLARATAKKPVVIIKAGTTARTQQAIQSHTGSMAGEAVVIEEAIKDAGGILVDNLEDFVAILKLLNNFSEQDKLNSNFKNLVIVTNAGGPGVITTDLIENNNLGLFEFNKEQMEVLEGNLPKEGSVENPIDLLGDAMDSRYRDTFNSLRSMEGIDGVLALVTPQAQTPIEEIVKTIAEFNRISSFPIFPVVIGGAAVEIANQVCQQEGVNNFEYPAILIRALTKLQAVASSDSIGESVEREQSKEALPKGRENDANDNVLLSYAESEVISKEFGLNTLPAEYPGNTVELRTAIDKLGLPLVMKVDSPNIVHKNELNGVVIGLDTVEKVEKEFERFQVDFHGEKILVQHQVDMGLEVIIGLKRDESFGLVLVIGLGGITTEILDEKILFVGEADKNIIAKKLKSSKLIKILKKQKISEKTLIEQAERLFKLGLANPDIKEIDVNPMFFYKDKEPVIVDFKIIV